MKVSTVVAVGLLALGACSTDDAPSTAVAAPASAEVEQFVDRYHEAWTSFDVDGVFALYTDFGTWSSDTPWGPEDYYVGDGEFDALAFENPIGGFVRWLEGVDWTMDEIGPLTMLENDYGDIYVTWPAQWSLELQGERLELEGFQTLWLVPDETNGFLVGRHVNLTPQTAGEQLGIPRPPEPYGP